MKGDNPTDILFIIKLLLENNAVVSTQDSSFNTAFKIATIDALAHKKWGIYRVFKDYSLSRDSTNRNNVHLKKLITKFERENNMQSVSRRVSDDPVMRERLDTAHRQTDPVGWHAESIARSQQSSSSDGSPRSIGDYEYGAPRQSATASGGQDTYDHVIETDQPHIYGSDQSRGVTANGRPVVPPRLPQQRAHSQSATASGGDQFVYTLPDQPNGGEEDYDALVGHQRYREPYEVGVARQQAQEAQAPPRPPKSLHHRTHSQPARPVYVPPVVNSLRLERVRRDTRAESILLTPEQLEALRKQSQSDNSPSSSNGSN
jgi:hypothetical protein